MAMKTIIAVKPTTRSSLLYPATGSLFLVVSCPRCSEYTALGYRLHPYYRCHTKRILLDPPQFNMVRHFPLCA